MSTQKHTPEPWFVTTDEKELEQGNQAYIYADGKPFKGKTYAHGIGDILNLEDAKRIIQCVNAFEGIEDPEQWMKTQKESAEMDIKAYSSAIKIQTIRAKAEKLLNSPSGTLSDIGEMLLKELKLL